jgi:DNA-binding MarR family transcriptional regulator
LPVNTFAEHLPPRIPLVLLFRLLHQHLVQEIDRSLREAGFTDIRPPHSNVFPFVTPDGIQVNDLAALAGVRKQSMAQSVEQLEAAGYVVRKPDPKDGRAQLVFLTERGEAVRPIAVAAGRRVEERWAELVGNEEIETLRESLKHLLETIRGASDSER